MNTEIENLGPDEQCVWKFLNHRPDTFVSEFEIVRQAGGRARFVDDPRWAGLALSRLVELRLVELDGEGKYRAKMQPTLAFGGRKRFIAPQLRSLLEKHAGQFHYSH